MKGRGINQGSRVEVALDVQIRPEEKQGTGREEEMILGDTRQEVIPSQGDGEGQGGKEE
jgi:hypothetical protein